MALGKYLHKNALAILILLSCTTAWAQDNKSIQPDGVGYFCNPPLPYKPIKLDILFIGNSFSVDTSSALPTILSSMGITTVNVYVLYKGGCSMKEHYENLKSGKNVYEFYQYNYHGETKLEKSTSIRDAIRRFPYDIVVFQQYSLESGDYPTYEPYLSKLLQAYKIMTISPRTTFAFNQTWAYSSKHKNIGVYKNQEGMYESICAATKRMKEHSGIDVIIPCGTAVQNARATEKLATSNEFTRDNQHIDLYMGRYLLGCTFFESVIAPCLGRSIRDDLSIYGKTGTKNQVNNSNRRILQNCARLAVANNYEVSEFVNE
ncbi:MAG: DUF4886 domain-containing protein [Bacteroides sp.]|nr:DUF4886 domain-containing protein [Roseburia sp.]MCM1347754.1 DUF4886 domain-containing protein [Bacteroides sp.]MCM1420488.1 DUF4886 domain-containing protein [Bacteroides sp.]